MPLDWRILSSHRNLHLLDRLPAFIGNFYLHLHWLIVIDAVKLFRT